MYIEEIPEITLLTDFVPTDELVTDRVILYHYPTGSVAEMLNCDVSIKHYAGPLRVFTVSGNRFTIVLHRGSAETADEVFDKIVAEHARFDFWMSRIH